MLDACKDWKIDWWYWTQASSYRSQGVVYDNINEEGTGADPASTVSRAISVTFDSQV